MDVGFIGAGRMGFHMVRRLIEAGHYVIVFDASSDAVTRAQKVGASVAASPAEVADRVETVMVSLPTPDIVQAVAKAVSGGKKIKRLVDLSTTRRDHGGAHRGRTQGAQHRADRSPVSGGVGGAEKRHAGA